MRSGIDQQNTFYVTGYGQSANRWFYEGLNLHPEIHCFFGNDQVTGELAENFRKPIKPSARYLGIVHRHTVRTVETMVKTGNYLGIVNLIRHPVTRVYSRANAFHKELQNQDAFLCEQIGLLLERDRELVDGWVHRMELDLSDLKQRAYLASCCTIRDMVDEISFSRLELKMDDQFQIPMERLTTDRGFFQATLKRLTGGKVEINPSYLDEVFEVVIDNNSERHVISQCPVRVVQELELWQKQVLAEALELHCAAHFFEGFGYDVGMVRDSLPFDRLPPSNPEMKEVLFNERQILLRDRLRELSNDEVPAVVPMMVEEVFERVHGADLYWGDHLLSIDKAQDFMNDPCFADAWHAVKNTHQYDLYNARDGIKWRFHILVWAARYASKLDGDFVECGVFKGDMSWFITECVDAFGSGRKMHLVDSYEGFNCDITSAQDFPRDPAFFARANAIYKSESHFENVKKRFKDKEYVRITKGYVPQVLNNLDIDEVAFLHIDLNSAEAEVAALEYFYPKLVTGGIIVLDDYGWNMFRKQLIAEKAFFSSVNLQVLELPTGQGLVIKNFS